MSDPLQIAVVAARLRLLVMAARHDNGTLAKIPEADWLLIATDLSFLPLAAPAEGLRLDPNSPEDIERLAHALCRRDGYVWANEPEWQREEWRGKARELLRVLCDIDRELAALETDHD